MSAEKPGDLQGLLDRLATPSEAEQAAVAADEEHRAHLARLPSQNVPQILAYLASWEPVFDAG